jgi:hypothetical protein
VDKKTMSELPYHQTHADYLSGPLAKTLRDMTYSLTSLARVLHRRHLGHGVMYLALDIEHTDLPQDLAFSAILLLPLSNMVDVFLTREKRTIASDDSEISQET